VSLWKAASYAISTRLSFLTIRPNARETSTVSVSDYRKSRRAARLPHQDSDEMALQGERPSVREAVRSRQIHSGGNRRLCRRQRGRSRRRRDCPQQTHSSSTACTTARAHSNRWTQASGSALIRHAQLSSDFLWITRGSLDDIHPLQIEASRDLFVGNFHLSVVIFPQSDKYPLRTLFQPTYGAKLGVPFFPH
jgi:hypothetical protein